MYCPFCLNEDTKVLESRVIDDSMRRRRACLKCENRFTTYERSSFNLTVEKKDSSIQPFDLNKISLSLKLACGKPDEQLISNLTKNIQQKILKKKTNPIKTIYIGKVILQELKKYNKIAYLRYISVHKEMNDPKIFEKELQLIT
jgi:transcriptional repressor NrdR